MLFWKDTTIINNTVAEYILYVIDKFTIILIMWLVFLLTHALLRLTVFVRLWTYFMFGNSIHRRHRIKI